MTINWRDYPPGSDESDNAHAVRLSNVEGLPIEDAIRISYRWSLVRRAERLPGSSDRVRQLLVDIVMSLP